MVKNLVIQNSINSSQTSYPHNYFYFPYLACQQLIKLNHSGKDDRSQPLIKPNIQNRAQIQQPIIPIFIKPHKLIAKSVENQNINQKNQNKKTKKIKRQKKKTVKNNENRNVLPNSIHQIFSFVMKKHKSGTMIRKIFDSIQHHPSCTVLRYYSYQQNLRDKINFYMKETSLKLLVSIHFASSDVYSIHQQHFYMKIARILALKYIDSEYIPLILNSRRMAPQKKFQHLKNRRELIKNITSIFKCS